MTSVGSLFSGIGGLDLGFERAGFRIAWMCEKDQFCRRVLARHWPGIPIYEDVHDVSAKSVPGVDVLIGGFPCQPFSVAGKRRGHEDDRWLWPEMLRLVRELRPRWVVAENVPGLRTLGADRVLEDLETAGYSVWPLVVGADDVGAPHRRKRVWFVAALRMRELSLRDSPEARSRVRVSSDRGMADRSVLDALTDPHDSGRIEQRRACSDEAEFAFYEFADRWPAGPCSRRDADGIPARVDRLRALGNAVVPQVADAIGRAIHQVMEARA